MELGAVDNSPTMWINWFIVVGIPIVVLVVGFLLFYFKPSHRRMVGVGLIIAVILEVSYYSFTYPRLNTSYPIEILTLLFAVVSLFYSTKYAKRKL
jgi:CHASE2 domain-containing sensor protein